MTTDATDGRRVAAAARRRKREDEILAATRGLFDQRGVSDAQIEDIARAVGVNRAIVYRHFTGKEELFALTLVTYLDELRDDLAAAGASVDDPEKRLLAISDAFAGYGLEHPAFVDCAQSLMRRTGPELQAEISEAAMYRLGQSMTGCLSIVSAVLHEGTLEGRFSVKDPDMLANTLYAAGLGALQLARVGMLVKEAAPGVPTIGRVSTDDIRRFVTTTALALATA